jgi:IMP dehydrogenase
MNYAYTYDDIQIIPKYSEVESRNKCNLKTRFTKNYLIDVPLVSSPMDTVTESEMAIEMHNKGGVGIIHRFMNIAMQVQDVAEVREVGYSVFKLDEKKTKNKASKNNIEVIEDLLNAYLPPVAAAIGATGDYKERAQELVSAGANVLLIDVAHGNTKQVKDAITWCKENLDSTVDIIAGNVATSEGAYNLAVWGADGIRVGIGNGSLCETRIRTGIGVPQVTALIECIKGVEHSKYDIPIIADGGIKMTGDVAKALSLGADSVMIGSLLAGTRESPGDIQRMGMWPNEQLFKKYRGSASAETKRTHGMQEKNVEGNSKLIPYKGKAKRIINDINDGIRSSMSYVNAMTITEFQAVSEHVLITQNGLIEAKPHLLL